MPKAIPLIARIVSNLLLPPFVLFVSYAITLRSLHSLTPVAFSNLLVAFLLIVLLPVVFFLIMMKTKRISDQDAKKRQERTIPYLFGLCLMCIGFGTSYYLHLPPLLKAAWLSFIFSLLFVLLINSAWKISAHLMSFTIAVTNLGLAVDRTWLFFLFLVPLLSWSRIYLKSHTVLQVAAGSLLGIALSVSAFIIFQ
jgi:membrane-associated phospholipid phosphatase